MKINKIQVLVGAALSMILLFSSVYTVHETQRAIVLRLGEIVQSGSDNVTIVQPGLHFKIPFTDTVKYMDARINSLEIKSSEIPTVNKKNVLVNLYVKWRVKDFGMFYKRAGGNQGWVRAKDSVARLIEQLAIDGVRSEIGKRTINEVVSAERQKVMETIQRDVSINANEKLGVEIVDIRIKRIDLPVDVSDAIYNLMRTERQKVAEEHRANGKRDAERIKAEADAESTIIVSKAKSEADKIRGEGDAQAAKIYASAYNKDKEFYALYRSLEVYENVFKDKNDVLILKPEGELFKYFYSSKGKANAGNK